VSLRAGMIVPFLVLGLAACGGAAEVPGSGGSPAAGAGSPAAVAGSPGTSAATTPTAAPATTPAGGVVEIKVEISGGRIVPRPSVHKVAKGRTVRIMVTSDENDELHVHGYDREVKLKAGRSATVEFTADQAGRFEVETHESGLQLFQLQVS
jgi:plastocyanin